MSGFRTLILALLLVCSVCTAHARESAEEKEQRQVTQFLAVFDGMCPGLLRSEFKKNPEMSDMGPEMIENMSGGACGCFVDELRAMPASQVAPMLKGKSDEMDALMSLCTVRSLKLHVGALCMDQARGSAIADAESKTMCDCVQTRMNDGDDATLAGLIANDDEKGFEALMAECKVE